MLRRSLALLLSLMLLVGMLPLAASATEPVGETQGHVKVTGGPLDGNKLGTLDLSMSTTAGRATVIWLVFSFDNTVIVPYDYDEGAPITDIQDGTIDRSYCFEPCNGFNRTGAKWAVSDNRTAVIVTYNTTDNDRGTKLETMSPIGKFHYTLAEGKTAADIKKGTFKIETDYSEGSFLKALKDDEPQAIHIQIKNGPSLGYADGVNPDTLALDSFTYPGSDKVTLGTLELASAGDATSVAVPKVLGDDATTTAATLALTATAKDTDGDAMQKFPNVTWSFDGTAPEGVTLNGAGANATLSVAPGAKAGTATVKVASGSVTATKAITITRDTEAAAAVKVFGNGTEITGTTDTIVIPPQSAANANTKTYTAKAFNQYGEEMNDTVNLSFATADANVTYSNGTVSVTKAATKGATYTLTAAIGGVSKDITIKLTDLEVNWTAVDSAMKSTMVYGTANRGAATNLPATGTATAGTTLNGSFEIKNPTAIQTVGNKTVTVVFTVTSAGDYKNITVEKDYTVEVTKKPVTVKADDKTVVYGQDFPEPTFTVPNGALVGDDTVEDLDVTLGYQYDENSEDELNGFIPVGTPVKIVLDPDYADASANYKVTVTPGKLTITKATILKAGNPEDDGEGNLVLKETVKYSALANIESNTYENMVTHVGGFADPDNPMDYICVLIDDGTEQGIPAYAGVKWSGPAEKYNRKGGTYTYTAAVVPGNNFNAYSKTAKVIVEIVPISGTVESDVPASVVIAKGAAEKATGPATFKLPASITIKYNDGKTDVTRSITPVWKTPDGKTWEALKTKAVNSKTAMMAELPEDLEWLTVNEKALTVEVQITDKFPVTVSVTQSGTTYGTPLGDPVATQTAIDDGTDGSATFSYQYTGTTAAGKTYNSADKPTEAGHYTVTATLVSDTHAGSGEADFIITPKTLTDGMVAAIPSETYNKEAHEPTVVVTDGTALKLDTDYTVTYQNNVNAGAATAVVNGKWNYTGTVNKNFTIDKASLAALTPTISGTAQVGKVLTANLEGVADSELTYQWKRGGTDITGATAKTYLLTTADSNKEITVVLTAKGSGNYTGSTLASEAVAVEKQAISGTVTITEANTTGTAGTIDEGDTLTAVTTGITPAATFTYQWYRDNEAIDSATSATYTVTAADADKTLKVVVTAGGDFQGKVEAAVEVGKAVLTGTPTISGASSPAVMGDELTVSFATGTEGEDYTVVWLRDGEPIPGAEGTTYTLTAEDQGKTVSAKVVGKGTYTGEVVSAGVAVPAAAPAKPTLKLSAKRKAIAASWTKPADNGAAILSYTLTITDGASYSETVTVSPDDTSYEFTDLTNGTEYTVTLKATNSVGDSPVDTQTAAPRAGGSIGGGGGSTTPEPVVTPGMDDSTISTLTEDNGTVTTTTTWPDGKESVAVVTPDGDVTITVKNADGETVTDVTVPAVIPDTGKKYDDVHTGDWFEENVYKTTNLGLFAGTSESKFSPQMNLNRGMLVTVLYRMSGEPSFGTDKNIFPDIVGDEWYADAADWANAMSVAAGTGKGFEPTADITRQDMVTLIYRYAKAIGLNPVESASLSKFKDGAKTSGYAQPAMQWAVSVGIINGKGSGVLDPRGNATRAEVATVLANFIKYLQK